jgi:hypothetical protein
VAAVPGLTVRVEYPVVVSDVELKLQVAPLGIPALTLRVIEPPEYVEPALMKTL